MRGDMRRRPSGDIRPKKAVRRSSVPRRDELGREQPRKASSLRPAATAPSSKRAPKRASRRVYETAPPRPDHAGAPAFGVRAGSRIRPKTAAVVLAVIAAVTVVGVRAQGSVSEARGDVAARVEVAKSALSSAQERLKAADLDGAGQQFGVAEQALADANNVLASRGLVGGIATGQGSGDIRIGQQMLATGEATARSGRQLLDEVRSLGAQTADSDQGFYKSGEVLSRHLPAFDRNLADLDRNLKQLEFLQQRASRSNNAELQSAAKTFAGVLPEARGAVAQGREIVDALPSLLGHDEFARYLVLFENPAELRPTGGFTGTYGRLTLNEGRMTEFTIESIYNPANQAKVAVNERAPHPLARLENLGPGTEIQWRMQDANWSPDFPESSRKYQWFYDKSGGPTTDGVIGITATPVVEILKALGPIEQPDGREPITGDSFLREVTDYQQTQAKAGSDPKTLLRDFAPQLLEKIRRATPEQQRRVRQILTTAITAKDIQIYFNDEDLESLAERAGVAGRLDPRPGELAVVDANLTATKSSSDLSAEVTRTITVDTEGQQRVDLSVTRRHSGNTSQDTNGNYTRIYLPKGVTVDGLSGWGDYEEPVVSREGEFAVIGGWTDVEPGGERTVTASYRPSDTVDLDAGTFPVSYWRQPGSNVRVITEIILPDGYVWDATAGGTVSGNVIRFDEPASADIVHRLRFRKSSQ